MTTATPPNPLVSGYHPDPSVLRVGDDFYLVSSTFEYLPGIPVQHSRDLVTWTTIGHVVDRPEQLDLTGRPTLGGIWAPTIRHHDGVFWIAVTDAMGAGTYLFHATDPAGPWSDPVLLDGLNGIDPDLAWDDEGTCYVTYSALRLATDGSHGGIEQVRADLSTGTLLEAPRTLWSGTGRMFPEGPHLYHLGEWWYLFIAEGGTERGHSVSVARGTGPEGPFDGCPANPLLTAAGTDRPVQNTGHGDLVQGPDGDWYLVLLGMRTLGGTRGFSPLGRETFCTPVTWADGWPTVAPVVLSAPGAPVEWTERFDDGTWDARWFGLRAHPAQVATAGGGRVVLHGNGQGPSDLAPAFVGVRQTQLRSRFTATFEPPAEQHGVGGVLLRYDERHHVEVEVSATAVVATAAVSTIAQSWAAPRPAGPVTLWVATEPVTGGSDFMDQLSSDHIVLGFDGPDGPVELARIDGRYYTAETAASFTGRVIGLYAVDGDVAVSSVTYAGTDA